MQQTQPMKLPQGPQTPALVQMLQWIASPMSFMETCAKRYGDIFTMQLNGPAVFVSNPQALQQISCCALNLYMGRGQDAHTTIILRFCLIQSSCASAY